MSEQPVQTTPEFQAQQETDSRLMGIVSRLEWDNERLHDELTAERAKVAELRNELRIQDEANEILTRRLNEAQQSINFWMAAKDRAEAGQVAAEAKVADAQLRATNMLRLCEERETALRAAESQAARLRAALEEAPHAEGCASHGLRYARHIEQYCDCFKRVLQGETK